MEIDTLGLDDESELLKWSRFCAMSFQEKTNPPSEEYFYGKVRNDPMYQVTDVLVGRLAASNKPFIATCRVFRRNVTLAGTQKRMAGIGEVCTDVEFRKQGYASMILDSALQSISNDGFEVCYLHAARQFWPMYNAKGFVNVKSEDAIFTIQALDTAFASTNLPEEYYEVRMYDISLLSDPDLESHLTQLAGIYDSSILNNGTVVRTSIDYWTRWILNSWKQLHDGKLSIIHSKTDGSICGYLVSSRDGDCMRVAELALAADIETCPQLFYMLVSKAIQSIRHPKKLCICPYPVLKALNLNHVQILLLETDERWMVRPGDIDMASFEDFVYWPTDKF